MDDRVTVTGVGSAEAPPDVLHLDLGVEVRDGDVSSALAQANGAAGKIRDALHRGGVSAADLQTRGLGVQTAYDGRGRTTGFVVTERLGAVLRDLQNAGRLITSAVKAGGEATRVHGLTFAIEDASRPLERAREAAFAEARAKASQYASLAGRPLGTVRWVRESGGELPARNVVLAATAARETLLEPGTAEVCVTVEVTWDLA